MGSCAPHSEHKHEHGPGCDHPEVKHAGHVDYIHEGHLHHPHGDHMDDHVVKEDEKNPTECTPKHDCDGHDGAHRHGDGCGHLQVPHEDHKDFWVGGHLHHPHGDSHCDDHGPLPPA